DADHRQLLRAPGLRVADGDGNRVEALILEVEARQLELRGQREVEVAAARHDRAVDDRQSRVLGERVPHVSRGRVAARERAQAERRVLEKRLVETAQWIGLLLSARAELARL